MASAVVKSTNGKVTRAASQLGITRRILGLRLSHFGISYRRFRGNDPSAVDDNVDSSSEGGR
jgi:Nif-specific regulatory protein